MENNYSSDAGSLAKELLKLYPNAFSTDFEANKAIVGKTVVTESKALRNEIAGHIARLKCREATGQLVSVPYVSSGSEGRKRRGRTRRR